MCVWSDGGGGGGHGAWGGGGNECVVESFRRDPHVVVEGGERGKAVQSTDGSRVTLYARCERASVSATVPLVTHTLERASSSI